jgi:predicted DNA binding CopG/RHH family protein
MDQPVEAEPSSNLASFAGLLAALTAPKREPQPAWNDDDLADDVATLSYERALHAHARYKPADFGEGPRAADAAEASSSENNLGKSPRHGATHGAAGPGRKARNQDMRQGTENSLGAPVTLEESRKRASITVRVSQSELAQLRQRAAEAGLTVSAYLRSCTFEAEALRAQVKEALAQLREIKRAEAVAPVQPSRSRLGWILRLLPSLVRRKKAPAPHTPGA